MEGKEPLWRWNCRYEFSAALNPSHMWVVEGRHVVVHLRIKDFGEREGGDINDRYLGGIEYHYRQPPDYMAKYPPSHKTCSFTGANCWHDGSSLQASEQWIPLWRMAPNDHEGMFRALLVRVLGVDQGVPARTVLSVIKEADDGR